MGAKPRNIELSLDNRPVAENRGSTIEKPKAKQSDRETINEHM